jgi:hypothetical protein
MQRRPNRAGSPLGTPRNLEALFALDPEMRRAWALKEDFRTNGYSHATADIYVTPRNLQVPSFSYRKMVSFRFTRRLAADRPQKVRPRLTDVAASCLLRSGLSCQSGSPYSSNQ